MGKRPGKLVNWLRCVLGHAGNEVESPKVECASRSSCGDNDPYLPLAGFASEMFTQFLLELPMQRRRIEDRWRSGDLQRLEGCVHQLLGATVYCKTPDLENALRDLHRALQTRDRKNIARHHAHALAVIDGTLQSCGCGEHI